MDTLSNLLAFAPVLAGYIGGPLLGMSLAHFVIGCTRCFQARASQITKISNPIGIAAAIPGFYLATVVGGTLGGALVGDAGIMPVAFGIGFGVAAVSGAVVFAAMIITGYLLVVLHRWSGTCP